MSLRTQIEDLLAKQGWELDRKLRYTYAYKQDEDQRYRVGERGLRKQRYTNDGWQNVQKMIPATGVYKYLKEKVENVIKPREEFQTAMVANPVEQVMTNPKRKVSSPATLSDIKVIAKKITQRFIQEGGRYEGLTSIEMRNRFEVLADEVGGDYGTRVILGSSAEEFVWHLFINYLFEFVPTP